jgi:hypothetical protein
MPEIRQLVIRANELEPFEIGAQLIGHLCFPGRTEDQKAAKLASALCANFLVEARKTQPQNQHYDQQSWPQYKVRENRMSIDGISSRTDKALKLGAVALAHLKPFAADETPAPPLRVGNSVGAMLRLLESQNVLDHGDARRRIFRRWLPVAPLAAAFRLYANMATRESGTGYALNDVVSHRWIAVHEQRFARIIAENDLLGWASSDPLVIRWIDSVQDSAAINH